jgi:hypothetical protein
LKRRSKRFFLKAFRDAGDGAISSKRVQTISPQRFCY